METFANGVFCETNPARDGEKVSSNRVTQPITFRTLPKLTTGGASTDKELMDKFIISRAHFIEGVDATGQPEWQRIILTGNEFKTDGSCFEFSARRTVPLNTTRV